MVDLLLASDPSLRVVVIDVVVPKSRHERVEYVRASITLEEHVRQALAGVDSVIHIASIIPDLRMQSSRVIELVNVNGTKNILAACKALGVLCAMPCDACSHNPQASRSLCTHQARLWC